MTRRILAVMISLLLAGVGTAAVVLYVRSSDTRAIEGKQARAVLIATKQIPAGTTARAVRDKGYVREVRMPAESLPEDVLQQVSTDLEALVTTAPVQRGQMLLRAMFGTKVSNATGLVVPDGKMAITARVKSNAFGLESVRPGTKVAIFYTYTPIDDAARNVVSGGGFEHGKNVNSVTRLLMTDVEVITAGSATGQDNPTGVGTSTTTNGEFSVTFALSQVDAERLAHAVALGGQLNVGVLGDSSDVKPDNGVDNRSLFG